MCMRGAEAIQAAGSAGTLPKWANIAVYAKMASDLQELSRTYHPARDFDRIRTVRLVLAKTVRTFTQAKVRHDQLAAAPRISPPMAHSRLRKLRRLLLRHVNYPMAENSNVSQ